MYCDTNINVKQAEKMLCKLFSELGIVRKCLTLMLFGNFSFVCAVSAKRIMLGTKMILKFHSEPFLSKFISSSGTCAPLNFRKLPRAMEYRVNVQYRSELISKYLI